MIAALEHLPRENFPWAQLEQHCPAEAAMIRAEAPLLGHHPAGCWLQTDEQGSPTALLLRNTAGGFTIAPLPSANGAELASFLQTVGYSSVTLPASLPAGFALPDAQQERVSLLEWTASVAPMPLGYDLGPISTKELWQNILRCFPATDPQQGEHWQWAFGLRCRRGTARPYGLWQQGELLCAAALSHIGSAAALVGFVGTPPALRGNGYGRLLAAATAAFAKEKGLRPLLCCRPALQGLYHEAGFDTIGEQVILTPAITHRIEE